MSLRRPALFLGLAASAIAGAQQPQREPVLSQVKVPHSYYWREMYVPQVTSGPSAVTWSPDGREVIYSMQGSLWRQRLGTTEARQLTTGPRYDYQPDWSPDGRFVVFASYDGVAFDLRALDLERGTINPILANGAVNVEPRWSPDGKRLAFVSTAFNGRWHIFVGDVRHDIHESQTTAPGVATLTRVGGIRLDSLTRITEDKDSGLARYYIQCLRPLSLPDVVRRWPRADLRLESRADLRDRWNLAHGGPRRCKPTRAALRGDDVEGAAGLGE